MSQAKLAAAKELIKEKKYHEARDLLRTMPNDPTAEKWLARLNEIIGKEAQSFLAEQGTTRRSAVISRPDDYEPEGRSRPAAPPPPPRRTVNMAMARTFRMLWGIGLLLSFGWLCYGVTIVGNVASEQMATTRSDAQQAGVALGSGLGLTFFLCSGLPFLVVFGLLYWRNGVAIREERRYLETIDAMQRR